MIRSSIGVSWRAMFAGGAAIALGAGCGRQARSAARGPEPSSTVAEYDHGDGKTMEELFAGRFPGVQVFHTPSGGISIRIRGTNSILGSSEPLYVVDGSPVQSGAGGLLFMNPNDIARIEVLKDIGSTAAYGVQGANGVILITTKTAKRR